MALPPKPFAGAAVCCLAALLAAGCGSDGLKTVPVRGTITYRGSPARHGHVPARERPGGHRRHPGGPLRAAERATAPARGIRSGV